MQHSAPLSLLPHHPARGLRLLPQLLLGLALLAGGHAAQARTPAAAPAPQLAPADNPSCPAPAVKDPAVYQAESRKPHPDRGVLWQLRKGDTVAYLWGSIHVGQLPWIFPGPRTAQALRAAPAIALELDPVDPATLQALTQAMREDNDRQKLVMRQNPELQTRMGRMAFESCVDQSTWQTNAATLARLIALGMQDMARSGYHPAYGIDLNLAAMAHAVGKPVQAIETAQEQLLAMGLGGDGVPAQLATPDDIRKALDDIDSGKNRQVAQKLAEYWESGDLAALEQLMQTCQCLGDVGMQAALLDTRNQRMAERLPAMMAAQPQLFIAVGLLHMVGDNNLLQLLQKQGFTVRQLTGKGAEAAAAASSAVPASTPAKAQ
ncbi:TraB/GumN family protein [Comamonas sp. JNW]|uniref:TraB/GumN family protein n=1 Tax=Comamonas sp. JNW TaxID=2170731 RepID=UPI0014035541|nr:TraB/GumN family protein [Comamonas sp. JNW]